MQRHMDLVRELLLRIESFDIAPGATTAALHPCDPELQFEGYTENEVDYHLDLLIDAGLVDGSCSADRIFHITKLTWSGHEFLDLVRDRGVWDKTKTTASQAGGFSLAILTDVAKRIISENLGRIIGATLGS